MESCDLDAVEARRLIGCKRLSAVELVESCIARILAVDPAVNAMVARDFDRARAAARACDAATMQGGALGSLPGATHEKLWVEPDRLLLTSKQSSTPRTYAFSQPR